MQGNDKTFKIQVTDEDNSIIDLTGGSLIFYVNDWQSKNILTKNSNTSSQITITNPTAGEAEIYMVPADTSSAIPGNYIFYINFTNSVGKLYTITTGEFQIIDLGSTMYIRNRIRNYTGDFAELNVLLKVQETTDVELNDYIQKAIENFNATGYITSYIMKDYPNMSNLIDGTVIQILIGKGILSARNMLTYQDNGGVTVQDMDTYGRYINLFNVMISKHHQQIIDIKRSINVESVYGQVESPMRELDY